MSRREDKSKSEKLCEQCNHPIPSWDRDPYTLWGLMCPNCRVDELNEVLEPNEHIILPEEQDLK